MFEDAPQTPHLYFQTLITGKLLGTIKMLAPAFLALAFAATAFAQGSPIIPAGYHAVYITSLAKSTLAIAPKTVAYGSTLVVFVATCMSKCILHADPLDILVPPSTARLLVSNGVSRTATVPSFS